MSGTPEPTRELSVTRYIAAPPETVWRVMADRMTEWWCPRPWTTEIVELDRRPGGRAAFVMRGPNGEEEPSDGVYLAYEPGRRFAFTDALNAELMPRPAFMIGIWEIAPEGEGTRYTARARHWTDEAVARHREMGFDEGWGTVAEQLAALCEAG